MALKKQKIKILFIEQTAKLGGAQVCDLQFQEYIDRTLFETMVVCPAQGLLTERLDRLRVHYQIIPMGPLFSTSLRIGGLLIFNPFAVFWDLLMLIPAVIAVYRVIKKNKIDVTLTIGMLSHFYGGIASKLAGVRCIYRVEDIMRPNLALGLGRKIFSTAAKIFARQSIVPSKAVQNEMLNGKDFENKVNVIYNAVDLNTFSTPNKEKLRQEYSSLKNKKVVGIFSRLTPWKGHREFILAAKKVKDQIADVKFVVVGGPVFEGPHYFDQLKDMVKELGLEESFIFTGFRQDIQDCIAGVDICVLPSIAPDPCPLVVLEAMALEKPVIGTTVGGVPELIVDGETGILVPAQDISKLAEAMQRLIQNPALCLEMGKRGRARIEQQFDMKRFIHEHEKVFADAAHFVYS